MFDVDIFIHFVDFLLICENRTSESFLGRCIGGQGKSFEVFLYYVKSLSPLDTFDMITV